MRLRSVHPGTSEEEVRARTGFPLAGRPGAAPTTSPPTAPETAALDVIDPFGRLATVTLDPGRAG